MPKTARFTLEKQITKDLRIFSGIKIVLQLACWSLNLIIQVVLY